MVVKVPAKLGIGRQNIGSNTNLRHKIANNGKITLIGDKNELENESSDNIKHCDVFVIVM